MDHLSGEGEWALAPKQAQDLPLEVLQQVKELAERLTRAVELQVKQPAAREEVITEMAMVNANLQCKAAILNLPLDPPPTIQSIKLSGERVPAPRDDKKGTGRKGEEGRGGAENGFTNLPIETLQPDLASSSYGSFRLQLSTPLFLRTNEWHATPVSTGGELGAGDRSLDRYVIVGDINCTPPEIEVAPGLMTSSPEGPVLWLRCVHPPLFLPRGQMVAQAIPAEGPDPTVCATHVIGTGKLRVDCKINRGEEVLHLKGLLDTGADVTIIPTREWPAHCELQNVTGHVQGVGGIQLAKQSKSVMQIKGPSGQLANIRLFVLDYKEPLLRRDLMQQWGVTTDIPDPPKNFCVVATEKRPTQKLNWKTDRPVWVEQWLLYDEKLEALEKLVEEQLKKGNIIETNSPWNSPVFVIKKPNKDKWRLLQDLRQINDVIEDMGSLQPGMPSPTMLPQNWNLAVIDIKDCFFQIPLHPDDAPRFAFSIPVINREAPRKRYHWKVLPQGMKNSPTICQWYVSSLLAPVRAAAKEAIIFHYMDDVLVCASDNDMLAGVLDLTISALVAAGFKLQEEKIQRMTPWKYLGLEITKRTIVPQKLAINTNN
ncbi:uncharacterized protein LOC121665331 [Corvus kubaryi]|uniref:uncharacterized protein LOC121665331 n=1 Tax=Corvus kubaryi TaxID=68294 RepID=UPI001C059864|nr:uncharacterized protein LOC121665331 [Corvus kubaryi]